MKLLLAVLFLSFSFLTFAGDHEGGTHTPNFCTEKNSCAHIRFEVLPTTKEMSEFIIHIIPSSEDAIVDNFAAKLWMDMGHGHGHGSAPLAITKMDEPNHYFASNGWFVMKGPWQVVVTYKENGVDQKVIIPLSINE